MKKSLVLTTIVAAVCSFSISGCKSTSNPGDSALTSRDDLVFFSTLSQFNGRLSLKSVEVDGVVIDADRLSNGGSTPSINVSATSGGMQGTGSITTDDGCTLALSGRRLVDGISTRHTCSATSHSNGNGVMGTENYGTSIVARDRFAIVFDDNSSSAVTQRYEDAQKVALSWVGLASLARLYGDESRYMNEMSSIAAAQEIQFVSLKNGQVRIGSQYGSTGHYVIMAFGR